MTPEQLVTSFELSRKLWDAGIRLETYFKWGKFPITDPIILLNVNPTSISQNMEWFPAPTASEIGERLPDTIAEKKERFTTYYILTIQKTSVWIVSYFMLAKMFAYVRHESLSEAMGQMLLWLSENGYLKGEK